MEVPVSPEGALSTPRFASRHPLLRSRTKKEDDVSPKSVIMDLRFVSPGSSSSSSMDRHILPEAGQVKWRPRHDRGYSISDGEFSDSDTIVDSTGTSRELCKVGNSGPLESLPETHSLALEASSPNASGAVQINPDNVRRHDWGDGEPCCRGLFPSFANGPTPSVLSDRVNIDPGCSEDFSATHAPASLRNDKGYQDGHDQATSTTITRSNSDAHTSTGGLRTPTSVSAVEDEDHNQPSEWSQTATSSESASEFDGKESSRSSTKNYTGSESDSQPREKSSRTKLPSSEIPSSLDKAEDTKRRLTAHSPYLSKAGAAGYPGTPLRFFPTWQAQLGSPPVCGQISARSPKPEKGMGSYSPASLSDVGRGLRFQHKFLSGPILGSMIPKPPPSKWDDAEKWIASPGHQESPAQTQHRPAQNPLTGRRHSIAGQGLRSYYGAGSPEYSIPYDEKPLSPKFEDMAVKTGKPEGLTHSASQKKRSKTLSFGDLSRRFDLSRSAGKPPAQTEHIMSKGDGNGTEPHVRGSEGASLFDDQPESPKFELTRELMQLETSEKDKERTPGLSTLRSSEETMEVQVPKHSRSVSMKEISINLPPSPPPVADLQEPSSHRDMGTQMTPVESQKNSTCTTPGFTTSPTRHNTPARSGRRSASLGALPGVDVLELKSCHLAKLELRKLAGDGQPTLDRNAVWNTREEELMESSARLRQNDTGNMEKCDLATRATAWEEAELTKYTARFIKDEAEIKAWEDLQIAKAEAEMEKTKAKIEKMRREADEKMKNRIAMSTRKAEEMRAAAQAIRTEQAAKTAQQAEQMRITGSPSPCSRSSFRCCFTA